MTDGDHWLVLTPEQRVMLKPWLHAWTVALVVQVAAVAAMPICFCVSTVWVTYLLIPVLVGYAGQRLIFAVCKLKVDEMTGEPPNWRVLVNSLSLALVAIAACGYFYFSFLLMQKHF